MTFEPQKPPDDRSSQLSSEIELSLTVENLLTSYRDLFVVFYRLCELAPSVVDGEVAMESGSLFFALPAVFAESTRLNTLQDRNALAGSQGG